MSDPTRDALAELLHDEWDRRTGEPSEPGVPCPDCTESAARGVTSPPSGDLSGALFVIFDGPPGPVAGRFVEVETGDGRSVKAAAWDQRDGYWRLGPLFAAPAPETSGLREAAQAALDLIANNLWNEDDSGDENQLERAYDRLASILGPSTEESVGTTLGREYTDATAEAPSHE